jgi:hypothetical protein
VNEHGPEFPGRGFLFYDDEKNIKNNFSALGFSKNTSHTKKYVVKHISLFQVCLTLVFIWSNFM